MPKIDLSISIASYNSKNLLEQCLQSLFKNVHGITFEVLLADNASQDGTSTLIEKKFPQVIITKHRQNLLFTKAHNKNLSLGKGRYFLLLNDDAVIHPNTIESIIVYLDAHPHIGLASCKQIDEHGKVDSTCSRFPHPLMEFFESSFSGKMLRTLFRIQKAEQALATFRYIDWDRKGIKEVEVLPGSFLLGRSELLAKVGYMDEDLRLFYSDTDFCKRAKVAGFLSYHFGNVSIAHFRAKTLAKLPIFQRYTLSEHDMLAYYKKYFGVAWWLFLWLAFRPNWLYWKVVSFKKNEV